MKPVQILFTLSTIAVAGIFSATGHATVPNITAEVTLEPSCAPWDGQAYELNVALPANSGLSNAHFRASIWGRGIEALKNRKSFEIENDGGMEGNGTASIYDGAFVNGKPAYMPIPIKVTIEPLEEAGHLTEPVGFGVWIMTITMPPPSKQVYLYKISPVIGQNRALCG